MKERLEQMAGLSLMPLNESALMLDDKLLVMDNLDASIMPCSCEELLAFKKRFPMKLSHDCILIVVDGTLRFSMNFNDCVLTASTAVLMTSGTIIEQMETNDAGFIMISSFQQNSRFFSLKVPVLLSTQQMKILRQSYEMLRTVMTDSAFEVKRVDISSHCVDMMVSVIESAACGQLDLTAKPTRQDEIVARFLKCVADNYREHRELGFYAGQLSLSLKYMSHVIYEQTGRHPSQWIKDHVILDAKTMLRSGRYTVQQVADELHFPNQSFFGKYFKEAVGVSPKKWK